MYVYAGFISWMEPFPFLLTLRSRWKCIIFLLVFVDVGVPLVYCLLVSLCMYDDDKFNTKSTQHQEMLFKRPCRLIFWKILGSFPWFPLGEEKLWNFTPKKTWKNRGILDILILCLPWFFNSTLFVKWMFAFVKFIKHNTKKYWKMGKNYGISQRNLSVGKSGNHVISQINL